MSTENNYKEILPTGKVLAQISTHVAVIENGEIAIYIKGFTVDNMTVNPERLYSIPIENKDDLFSIFERYSEDNSCNVAEANGEL